MSRPEQMPHNRLDAAFSRYVSDGYENGEFELTEVRIDGDPMDGFDGNSYYGNANISMIIGETVIQESTFSLTPSIRLNDGEVSLYGAANGDALYMWNDTSGIHSRVFKADGTIEEEPGPETPTKLDFGSSGIVETFNEITEILDEE